jgi:hypothetical protein
MGLAVLVAVVVAVLLPAAAIVLRLRRGDELVPGGSDGIQMRTRKSRRRDDAL